MLSTTIVVPTHNRPEALARTLAAIGAMPPAADPLEIVVVDTGRGGPDVREIAALHATSYLHHAGSPVAAARNRGAAAATGELLLFIDDDIVVKPDHLERHQAAHADLPRCLVGGRWEFDPDFRAALERTALGRYRLRYEDRYNVPDGATLAASNLSIRRGVFESLGGFDERFPFAAEDQDLSWRARQAGCVLVYDVDIRVIHNDQHAGLTALCRRQERAAIGTVCFATKHPDAPRPAMLELNGPLRRADSPRLLLRKVTRAALSGRAQLWVALRLARAAEAVLPGDGRTLERVYDGIGGLHVFRGVRQGVKLTSAPAWTAQAPRSAAPTR